MPIELQTNLNLIPEPSAPQHVVNVRWVEKFFQGLQKAPVRLVATVNQAGTFDLGDKEFTYTAQGPVTIDGEEVDQGDRVLFTQQTDQRENLIFECTTKGTAGTDETVLTLASDADEDTKLQPGITVTSSEGDDHAGKTWRLTTQGTIVIGTTALDWEPYEPPKTTEVHGEDFEASDGTATASGGMEWEIEHNLGTTDVQVQIYNRGNNSLVLADVEATDPDTVTITFGVEPPGGVGYRAVVIG